MNFHPRSRIFPGRIYLLCWIGLLCVVSCAPVSREPAVTAPVPHSSVELAPAEIAVEPQDVVGQVTRVIDGDTIDVRVSSPNADADSQDLLLRVRLAQIDAPEKAQPYGKQSTAALSALVLGKWVRVEVVDVDRYGRSIGEIYAEGIHLNSEMVRQGHAWAYTRYAKSVAIIELEDEARQHVRGLWKLPAAERDPPWEWRRSRRGSRRSSPGAIPEGAMCGAKHTCKEMLNCAEARFYLSQCGLTNLDRDSDGVPCESLCW